MSSGVPRSKSAPTTKPLAAHFIPKNVSFSALETSQPPRHTRAPTAESTIFDSLEELYRSPLESPLTQRVEAFNLSGGFFPTQAHEVSHQRAIVPFQPLALCQQLPALA
ncbi:hypothetical protein RSAG8_06063, partial [Rhizoctonia solani AG-8 WAC10335]